MDMYYRIIYLTLWLSLAIFDCCYYRLPDRILILTLLIGLKRASPSNIATISQNFWSISLVYLSIFSLYLICEAYGIFLFGLGDLKMLAITHLLHGWQVTYTSLLIACITLSLSFLYINRKARKKLLSRDSLEDEHAASHKLILPLGPPYIIALISQL